MRSIGNKGGNFLLLPIITNQDTTVPAIPFLSLQLHQPQFDIGLLGQPPQQRQGIQFFGNISRQTQIRFRHGQRFHDQPEDKARLIYSLSALLHTAFFVKDFLLAQEHADGIIHQPFFLPLDDFLPSAQLLIR